MDSENNPNPNFEIDLKCWNYKDLKYLGVSIVHWLAGLLLSPKIDGLDLHFSFRSLWVGITIFDPC